MELHSFYIYFELFATIYLAYIAVEKGYVQMVVEDIFKLKKEVEEIKNNFITQVDGFDESINTIEKTYDNDASFSSLVAGAKASVQRLKDIIVREIPNIDNAKNSICETIAFSYTAFYIVFYCIIIILISGMMHSSEDFLFAKRKINLWSFVCNYNILTLIYLMVVWRYDSIQTKKLRSGKANIFKKLLYYLNDKWDSFQIVVPSVEYFRKFLKIDSGFKITMKIAFFAILISLIIEYFKLHIQFFPSISHGFIILISILIPVINLWMYYRKANGRAKNIRDRIKIFHPTVYDITTSPDYRTIITCMDAHKIVQERIQRESATSS